MNKAEFSRAYAQMFGVTQAEAARQIEFTLNLAYAGAMTDGRTCFGAHRFTLKTRPARMGSNPRTGEAIQIPEKKRIVYKRAEQRPETRG